MGKLIKFDYVNEHGDFEKVLSHFGLDYQKRGKQLRLLCPFHDDTNPSLSVTLEADGDTKANTWHCFGCKNSGSLIDFAALIEGGTLRDAAETVAEVSGCGLAPAKSGTPKKQKSRKGSERPVQRRNAVKQTKTRPLAKNGAEAASRQPEHASDVKPDNEPLRFSLTVDRKHPYVQERISPELAELFGVGVVDVGSRSMMAGRCCVPIHNLQGELIAYAGRYLGDDPDEPKWQLPPKFHKMRVLYNAHRVWGSLHVILVEGFFDAMHLHSLGIPAVSCIGTAVSDEQVSLLAEIGVRRVTILFDGDEEGQKAAEAVAPVLARKFFVRLGSLPVGCDPDETDAKVLIEQARAIW